MIQRLKQLLDTLSEGNNSAQSLSVDERQLATAALLIEVATIDQSFDASEEEALSALLLQQFSLNQEEVDELILHAKTESKESSSLYQFTVSLWFMGNCLCGWKYG